MSTMTPHQAWQSRRNAAARVGADGRQPTAPAFGRDLACVVARSEGRTGIGGTTSDASRAFLSGNDT